jgi:hypothetical protein
VQAKKKFLLFFNNCSSTPRECQSDNVIAVRAQKGKEELSHSASNRTDHFLAQLLSV